ncbi:hypothetical protein PI124_g17576 [Phytophthora idaei]|nr:hypothetical protein PI125_g23721 [Phytophthora idaei]KAG3138606.1 hypothetical protein PI126_g16833 [Phytophthora idaei]KAG3237425.1 hypothetical protein PI124_g17576 [Phytophthora idaei]
MDQNRKEASDATVKLTELDCAYLDTQHRYQELRDQLILMKGTANMNFE